MDVIAKVDDLSGEMVYFTRGLGIAPGVGDVLAETHILGSLTQTYVYVQNHRGDTVALVNTNGAVVGRYDYGAWGDVVSHIGADAWFTFSGKHYDADAGLYYYGMRWYDPAAKRWTQPDPSGLIEGLDLYQFCYNDPINRVDVYGTFDMFAMRNQLHQDMMVREAIKGALKANTGYGWLDAAANFISSRTVDRIADPSGINTFMMNYADRYCQNVCALGNNPWKAGFDAANLALGDFVGYTPFLEGCYGIDRSTLNDLSTAERGVRGTVGGVQMALSVFGGVKGLDAIAEAVEASRIESALNVLKGMNARQNVPNPFGRLGSPEHVSRILDAEETLVKKGWNTISGGSFPEKMFAGRYPDLVMRRNGSTIAIQVGRITKQLLPVGRERKAIATLRSSGLFNHVFFLVY